LPFSDRDASEDRPRPRNYLSERNTGQHNRAGNDDKSDAGCCLMPTSTLTFTNASREVGMSDFVRAAQPGSRLVEQNREGGTTRDPAATKRLMWLVMLSTPRRS